MATAAMALPITPRDPPTGARAHGQMQRRAPRRGDITGTPTRILMLNKYLYPKGGAETHMLTVGRHLAQSGHHVRYFGMQSSAHPITVPTAGTVPEIDYRCLGGPLARLRSVLEAIYSPRAYRAVRNAIRHQRPQVAHLHNVYHQLSPSVLVALRRAGIPTVMTAHDYKLVCPTYLMSSPSGPCFRCRGSRYWQVLRTGCSPHGRSAAVFYMLEAYVHRAWRTYQRHVDVVLAPSRFLHDRLIEGGWPHAKVRLLRNPISLDHLQPSSTRGDYLLFVGRLSPEKGLPTLLEAATAMPDVPIWVAGDGPFRDHLERTLRARNLKRVRLLGTVPHDKIVELFRNCRAVVLPSRSPENCPVCILEAFACAKPVVASRIGGIPELVEPTQAGWLVTPGHTDAWADALATAWDDPAECSRRGRIGRAWVEAHHDLDTYCRDLVTIYGELMGNRQPSSIGLGHRAESG